VFGSRGEIEFRDVNMRYRPGLPLVLCGLSFKVDAGFKVGVVGRTGAGKSSLIGALFRLTEIESGCISIDGVNTKTLGLRKLRSSMALIPQVPVIFAGSIRENLAPFGGHSDAALWSALRRSHLAPVVEKWESDGLGGLDYVLGEGGAPLSAGQKQLLALARALLNPAKILVLDEATANVDVETDALIQETLRTEFSERTLVAVAHRLHTIIEADRVLVMEKGKAVEYGAPAQLLEDQQGHFTGMVRETGDATEKFLRSMAAGDISAHRELQDAAAAALANICLPCDTDSPACFNTLASQLTNGASTVNHQLSGLLRLLQTSDLVPRCGAAAAAVAGSTKQDRAAVLQQLKAALAATSQLQRLALQAQELLAAAAATPDGGSSTEEGRRGILASVSEQLEQASLTGSTDETPFAPNISQLLVGSAPGTGFVMTPRRMQAVTSMPVRRFSHDDATWGLRPAATTGAGFNNRRAQTSSGGGRGLDGGSGARILRETLSFPANSSSSTGAGMPGSSSVGDGTYQRPLPRQRSIMARLSLDVPAAALAAAAAAARGGARDGSSSSSTQGV
jgi:ABC-type multidrug transport system ATPase subunit